MVKGMKPYNLAKFVYNATNKRLGYTNPRDFDKLDTAYRQGLIDVAGETIRYLEAQTA